MCILLWTSKVPFQGIWEADLKRLIHKQSHCVVIVFHALVNKTQCLLSMIRMKSSQCKT